MRWTQLTPEPLIVAALERAGDRPNDGTQNEKRHWSERFADGCAFAIAEAFRRSAVKDKRILPSLDGRAEPLTPLAARTSKRIDVTVVDPVLGLEIGASLKGLNFPDSESGGYDKNLTGRLYELADEVRLVHEHLPHAFMVGMFFLPLESTRDKSDRATSSFARTIIKLRERTGRLDAALAGHAPRCDASYVALYSTGEEAENLPPGVCRLMDVRTSPPRRGRPKIEHTYSLQQVIERVVASAKSESEVSWSDPEAD